MSKTVSGFMVVIGLIGALVVGSLAFGSGTIDASNPVGQAVAGLFAAVFVAMFFAGALHFSRG